VDPGEVLPTEGGKFIWLVEKWTTAEALESMFGELDELELEPLHDRLDAMRPEWVRISDWEDANR